VVVSSGIVVVSAGSIVSSGIVVVSAGSVVSSGIVVVSAGSVDSSDPGINPSMVRLSSSFSASRVSIRSKAPFKLACIDLIASRMPSKSPSQTYRVQELLGDKLGL